MKGTALKKESLYGKIAASVLLKLLFDHNLPHSMFKKILENLPNFLLKDTKWKQCINSKAVTVIT